MPGSIRRRLLLFLISALLLMVSGAAAVTYWVALNSANNAYDRLLLDPVLDIADNVRVDAAGAHLDLPRKALEALVYDQVDKVMFQIRSAPRSSTEPRIFRLHLRLPRGSPSSSTVLTAATRFALPHCARQTIL
jgi:hypothetical protein